VEQECGTVQGCTSETSDPKHCVGRCTRAGSRSVGRLDCGGARRIPQRVSLRRAVSWDAALVVEGGRRRLLGCNATRPVLNYGLGRVAPSGGLGKVSKGAIGSVGLGESGPPLSPLRHASCRFPLAPALAASLSSKGSQATSSAPRGVTLQKEARPAPAQIDALGRLSLRCPQRPAPEADRRRRLARQQRAASYGRSESSRPDPSSVRRC
jgi:hypothetical protein